MWVYIVTFEGAYGTQIAEVFTTRRHAEDWIAENADFYHAYNIVQKIAY